MPEQTGYNESALKTLLVRSMRMLFCLSATAIILSGTAPVSAPEPEPGAASAVVTRARFQQHVVLTCELEAVRSVSVTAPRGLAGQSSFTVAKLTEEGTPVEKGEVVLRLDSRELLQKRIERETELVDVRAEMESKRLESQARQAELRAELAEAEARQEKAAIDASVDPLVISSAKLQEARHELEMARVELGRRRSALETVQKEEVSDLAILGIREKTALTELEQADRALQAFEVKASQAGIFVLDEDWSDRKVRVGDSIWAGNTVATIQDVSEMRARCDLDQADGHLVQPGMKAELRLDVQPEQSIAAEVSSVAPYAESPGRSWWRRSRVRVFKLVLSIDASLPELTKPGLTARADVLVLDRDGLVLPRHAVVFDQQGSWVRVLRGGAAERVPVELEARNPTTVLIGSGAAEGDRVELNP